MPQTHFLALECLYENFVDFSRGFDELTQTQTTGFIDNRLDNLLCYFSIGKLFDYWKPIDLLVEGKD